MGPLDNSSVLPKFPDVLAVVFPAGGDELQGGLPAPEHLALGREKPLHGHLPVLGLHVRGPGLPPGRQVRVLRVPLHLQPENGNIIIRCFFKKGAVARPNRNKIIKRSLKGGLGAYQNI